MKPSRTLSLAVLTGLLLSACGGTGPATDAVKPTVALTATPSALTTSAPVRLTATASDNVAVTGVTFYRGDTRLGEDTTAPYELSDTPTATGTTTYRAVARDAAGNTAEATAAVTLTPATTPPTDTTKPTADFTVTRNSATSYTVNVTAQDDRGVTRVEIYDGDQLIATRTAAPYTAELTYSAAQNGTRTIRVRVFDAEGNVTEVTRQITVGVDATAPTVTASVSQTASGRVTILANARDDQGITRVEFYEGGVLIGTDTEAPYTLERTYTAAQNGRRTVTVRAYDAQGNTAETTVSFTIDVDLPPTVSLRVNRDTLARDNTVTVTADARDDRGITKVEFYVDGVLRTTDTQAPYTADLSFTFRDNGSRVIRVVAYDTAGQTTEATQVITVALDAGEVNDSVATATLIGVGQPIDARIAGVPRDYDYYKFTGAAGERLRLTVRGRSGPFRESTLDPYVMVLMPDGKTVLEKDDDSGIGLDSELLFNLPQAGTYYVVVTSFEIADDPTATDDRITNQYRLELSRR